MKKLIAIILLFLNILSVNAHQSSTSFISLEQTDTYTKGSWKVSINVLNTTQSMDADNNGEVIWSEVKAQKDILLSLLTTNFGIQTNKENCSIKTINSKSLAIDDILGMHYVVVPFKTDCKLQDVTKINYNFYFSRNSDHKAILSLKDSSTDPAIYVLSSDKQLIEVSEKNNNSFMNVVVEGIWHIWVGFDHIIFVITLLIGVLFIDSSKSLINHKNKLIQILKVVTAFTIAHSITLALAAFNIVVLPVMFVEAFIAATLIIAALHNLNKFLPDNMSALFSWPIWKMAFIFGLIHGFGFANVLTEIDLSTEYIATTLLAFNLGVEIGQIVIVSLIVGIVLVIMDKKRINHRLEVTILSISSAGTILLSSVWLVERSFDIAVF